MWLLPSWTFIDKRPIETLGIVITDDEESNYKSNFQQQISTLKSILNIWNQSKLSLKGKHQHINNLDLTKFIYISSVLLAINEINNIIQNIMWDDSTSKIDQKTLVEQIEKGGLKLYYFEKKVKALKLSWVKIQITEINSTWKLL